MIRSLFTRTLGERPQWTSSGVRAWRFPAAALCRRWKAPCETSIIGARMDPLWAGARALHLRAAPAVP